MDKAKIGPKYFDELQVGDEFITPSRTLTETDVVTFAAMSGDYNEIHTSEEVARKNQFGRRLVHGLLGLAVSHGLLFRLALLDGTAVAFLEIKDWKFTAPIFIGDTVKAKVIIEDKRASRSKPEQGIVWFRVQLINQDGVITQEGIKTIMMKKNPATLKGEVD